MTPSVTTASARIANPVPPFQEGGVSSLPNNLSNPSNIRYGKVELIISYPIPCTRENSEQQIELRNLVAILQGGEKPETLNIEIDTYPYEYTWPIVLTGQRQLMIEASDKLRNLLNTEGKINRAVLKLLVRPIFNELNKKLNDPNEIGPANERAQAYRKNHDSLSEPSKPLLGMDMPLWELSKSELSKLLTGMDMPLSEHSMPLSKL